MMKIHQNGVLMGFVVSFIVITIFLIISRLDYFQGKKECEDCGKKNNSHVLEKWIVQKLDNFDLTNNETWLMRYYENDQFFNKSGPILIYFGGEWEIYPNAMNEGVLYLSDLAKDFNGSLFYTEHRYYGKSHPTNDTSLQHLKYLNVEQALEDFANFVRFLKMQPRFKDSKIMVFGASYSGTLAVWFRQQYSHLVDAVWASSAVLNLKVDFVEYKEAMTEAFQKLGGENCTDFINSTFMEIEEILESGNSSRIERSFNLSQPLKTPQDRSVFMSYISDIFAGYVQYHRNNSIVKVCKQLLESRYEDEIETVGHLVSQNKSLNVTYNHFLHIMSNVSWSAPVNRLWRPFFYQMCTQVGFFQTSSSEFQIFGTLYPLEFFKQYCLDIYGQFSPENIKKTNEKYGGLQPNVTKVYFSHGSLDPWRNLGVQVDLNEESPAIVLQNASHCADMRSISENDTPEMVQHKKRIRELLKKWLNI